MNEEFIEAHKDEVGTTLKTAVSKGGLKIKKYSPEILMVAGITGVVGAAVLACKATLKCEDLIDEHDGKMFNRTMAAIKDVFDKLLRRLKS